MYEIFEHTADFGIRARAEDIDQLFAEAARALFSLMVENLDAVQPMAEVHFELAADDVDGLLHDWLAELLYTFHTRHFLFCEFHVKVNSTGLKATARGEPLDRARHQIDMEVKAVTWHAIKAEQRGDEWLAEIIVDV